MFHFILTCVFIIAFIVIAFFNFLYCIKLIKIRKFIKDTPTSKIGFLKSGAAEVCGKIKEKNKLLTTPLSQKKCVYYKLKIIEGTRKEKTVTVYEENFVPFYLEDDSGQITVDMKDAETSFNKDKRIHTGFDSKSNEVPEHFRNYLLEKHNFKIKGLVFVKPLDIQETYLEPNDLLYVLGDADIKLDENKIYKKDKSYMLVADTSEKMALEKISKKIRAKIIFVIIFLLLGLMAMHLFVIPEIVKMIGQ